MDKGPIVDIMGSYLNGGKTWSIRCSWISIPNGDLPMLLSLKELGMSGRGFGLGVERVILSAQVVHS